MERSHSRLEGFFSIIFTMDEWFSSDIVFAFNLRWVESKMIASSTTWMDSPANDSFSKFIFVYLEFKNLVDIHLSVFDHSIKFFGLRHSSRETIEKDTSFTLWLLHCILYELNDDLIGNQCSTLHHSVNSLT